MILTCAFCHKEFKVKEPLINLCNKCSRQSTRLLKKINKKSNIKLNYSDFYKVKKENPRDDISYNDYIKKHFN